MKALTASLPPGSLAFSAGSVAYLVAMAFLTGLRAEHWAIVVAMNVMFHIGGATRRFVLGFAIFAVFGMLYDVMRVFPNYNFNNVDIENLYLLEKQLFGIGSDAARLTPNEYFNLHHTVAGDFISGFFYINWIPVPLGFAAWLYFTDRKNFLHYSLTFFLVNLIGFAGYYIHPAAPPWYVALHGFDLHLGTPGNTAGLERFDALIGFGLFESIYAKNSNVFAAIPSLHSAYPVVVLYYAFRSKPGWLVWPLFVFMLGIWFAAVYSAHHYVIDVILGLLCALAGIALYRGVLMKTATWRRFTEGYIKLIS